MLRGASRPLIGGLRTAAILRRASRPLIGGLRTAAILRRLQSFSSQAEMHLKNYKEKETTIMVVKLDDGDFLVGSDSRRTVAVGSDSFITCEVANKVNYLGRSVLLARAGSVLYLKRCVRDMLSASFSVVDRCLENVLKKGTQYVNWLNCDASLGFIVMGYVKGIGRMFLLAYFKNKDSSAVRMLEELSRFYCIGSGAEYLAEYVNPRLNELTCIDLKSILNLAEIGFLIASLKDRCTGGHITVRRFTPKGVEVVSQNTVLGLVKKYYGLLAPSYERSILVVFKMLVVEIFVDGEYNPCLVPDVDMELLKGVIGGEESLRAHDFGHPLASLCGDFYVQIVRFAEVDSVDCFMRMAHEVPDQEVLFAYRSCGVKEFVVGGKSVYVMAATRSNLENLKDCLPPIDPSI